MRTKESPSDASRPSSQTLKIILATLAQRQSIPVVPQEPLNERSREEFIAILFGGVVLAWNAGYINAVAISDDSSPVSHVTGAATHTGIALAHGKFVHVLSLLLLIASFIFGSFLAGLMISKPSFHLGRAYGRIFLLASVILACAVIVECTVANSSLFVYLLAVVCGLQNGMTTRYSGAVLRTTHVTGSATDIGIILGRYMRGHTSDMWKCNVLVTLMIGYIVGGSCGALMHMEFGRMAILLNIVLYSAIGVIYTFYIALSLKVPLISAALSNAYLYNRMQSLNDYKMTCADNSFESSVATVAIGDESTL